MSTKSREPTINTFNSREFIKRPPRISEEDKARKVKLTESEKRSENARKKATVTLAKVNLGDKT